MNKTMKRWLVVACAGLGAALGLHAQTYPDRPVRVVVPFAAGNTLDTALRQLGEEFKKDTGQQIIVDAKPGGSGIIAAQTVMQAPPDGYTLLLSNTSMLTINPYTFSKLPYDTEKSFKHVTGFVGASMVLAVNAAQVPANNLKEFIAWVKTQPGKVSYASFTAGNSSHFAGVILNQRAGLDMVHVPFNGTPPRGAKPGGRSGAGGVFAGAGGQAPSGFGQGQSAGGDHSAALAHDARGAHVH